MKNLQVTIPTMGLLMLITVVGIFFPGDVGASSEPAAGQPSLAHDSRAAFVDYANGKITIRASDVEIGDIMQQISKATGVKLVVGEGISGKISIEIAARKLEDAISEILEIYGARNMAVVYKKDFAKADGYKLSQISVLRESTQLAGPKDSTRQIIRYDDETGLTVKVREIDLMMLLGEIERQSKLHSRLPRRFVAKLETAPSISVDFENKPFGLGMKEILRQIKPGQYKSRILKEENVARADKQDRAEVFEVFRLSKDQEAANRTKSQEYLLQAKSLYEEGRYLAAPGTISQAVDLDPENMEAQRYESLIFSKTAGPKDAIRVISQYLRSNPADGDLHFELARVYCRDLDVESAIYSYRQAQRHGKSEALIQRAKAAVQELDNDRVKEYFNGIRTAARLVHSGNFTEAEKVLLDLTGVAPERSEAFDHLGSMYLQQHRNDEAISIHEKLLEKRRESLDLSILAQLHMNAGRYELALSYLDQIVSMGPGKETMEQVNYIREMISRKRKEHEKR